MYWMLNDCMALRLRCPSSGEQRDVKHLPNKFSTSSFETFVDELTSKIMFDDVDSSICALKENETRSRRQQLVYALGFKFETCLSDEKKL